MSIDHSLRRCEEVGCEEERALKALRAYAWELASSCCPCGRPLDDVGMTPGCEGCEERHAELLMEDVP